ncbi:MAG: TonB-dependent receptor [Rhodothermales bacterium]
MRFHASPSRAPGLARVLPRGSAVDLAAILTLLAVASFTTFSASAQSISGRVTDADTGEPLPGASVVVSPIQIGTATDLEGRYTVALPRPGTYRLTVSFIGFRTESASVEANDEHVRVDIALKAIEVEVPGITITAKAQASDILSTPQAVAVIEGRDLRENRGVALFDALDETPGVRTLTTGVGIAKPMIRGLTSQRVLVIQNGVRQEGQQWGDEHGPELDAFDVDRIEVVKGPASLLYGSDALGGVIQASSEDLFDQIGGLNGVLSLQALSNPELGASNLFLSGAAGDTYYAGSLTWKRAASYQTPRGPVPNTAIEEMNGSIRAGQSIRRGRILAEYQRFDARLAFFEPGAEREDTGFRIDQPFQDVSHDKVRARADLRLADNRLEMAASWQQNRRKEFEEEGEELTKTGNANESLEPALFLRLNTVNTDFRLHHRPFGRLFGTIGLSGFYQKNETLAEETLIPGAETWNGAAYFFEELMLSRVTLSGGVRYDARRLDADANEQLGVAAQSRSYRAVTGAAGAAWQPVSSLSIAGNVGRAWRAPALIELFGNGVHEGTVRFERGDPSLHPEQSLSVDATVRWLHPHIYVEVNAFTNDIDKYIFVQRTGEIDVESGFVVYQFRQAKARIWGGEVQVDIHPHPLEWLHFHIAGDVTRSKNLNTGDPLPQTPPSRLRFETALTKEKVGRLEDIRLRFGPTLVAEQDRVGPLELPTRGYSVWNASLSGRIQFGGLEIEPMVAVDNLLDESYLDHLSRFRPFGILEPGRSVRLQLVAEF